MPLTRYATELLNQGLFGGRFTPPSTLYLGLSLAPASRADQFVEPDGAGYGRLEVANTAETWGPAQAQPIGQTQTNLIEFVFAEAEADWGTVYAVGVFDGDNRLLATALLYQPVDVRSSDTFRLDPGSLRFTLA